MQLIANSVLWSMVFLPHNSAVHKTDILPVLVCSTRAGGCDFCKQCIKLFMRQSSPSHSVPRFSVFCSTNHARILIIWVVAHDELESHHSSLLVFWPRL